MKIGRNDMCPCGSGEKYKKCCINKNSYTEDTFNTYLQTHDSIELLKIISLVQLLPINQAKLIRLESIQDMICSNLKTGGKDIDYNSLKKLITKDYSSDHREDPAESCGTENFMFYNGNSIVFPGIAKDSTHINQMLINSFFAYKGNLSKDVESIIIEGVYFMLHIHDKIAKHVGLKRFLYEDDWRGEIHFPQEKFINEKKDIFEFSKSEIQGICKQLKINENVIQYFVTTKKQLIKNKTNETLLIKKPFIEFNQKYYLALPSAQMYCVNLFIREQIKKANQIDVLHENYKKMVLNESGKYLNIMWDAVNFKTELESSESIFNIDKNKYVYVRYIDSKTNDTKSRANRIIDSLKKEIGENDIEFMVVIFFATYEIDKMQSHAFPKIEQAKFQLALSFFDFERIYNHWHPDKLTLWKYAKAQERAENANLRIAPFFSTSILASFQWYKKNKDSFFPPDDQKPDFLIFDYSTQAELIAESAQKSDKHFIMHVENEIGQESPKAKFRFLPVIKTKDYAPIYTSEEIFNRKFRKALEVYTFPIWFSFDESIGSVGNNFVESIIYWLFELYEPLNPHVINLGNLPIEIILSFDEKLKSFLTSGIEIEKGVKINIGYEIDAYLRKIKLNIPIEIFSALHRKDNHGERIMIDAILNAFSKLLLAYNMNGLNNQEIKQLLSIHMPLSSKKMLLTSHEENAIKKFDSYIPKVRYVQDADIAVILESQVNWMNLPHKIPKKIKDDKKIGYLTDLTNTLIQKLKEYLVDYDAKELLEYLMLRHEAVIHSSSMWDLDLPARIKCFEKYQDVIKEYKEDYSNVVKASHSLRSLIEYVLAESPKGCKRINDDDTDFLLALVNEIINYGTIRDSISIGIDNPDMGLLPSGRLGMSHDFHDKIIVDYRDSVILDEIQIANEDFENNFKTEERKVENDTKKEEYYDKVTNIFEQELGIDFYQIQVIAEFLATHCFRMENSIWHCSEQELVELIMEHSNLSKDEILSFLSFMVLESRGGIENIPDGFHAKETWIWRFNRQLSYIRRPIIKLKVDNTSEILIWSARHLKMASDNLKAIFYNGTLKINETNYPKITALINDRLLIKSKEFRVKVLDWFKTTSLQIIDYEIKIRKSTFPNADRDYGDIDILAIDHNKKSVYLIECKNTRQAKVLYDFQSDIKNYVDKQLPKHINRAKFVIDNLEQLSQKINIDLKNYKTTPIVIASFQLPVKYLHEVSIPIYSFNEIKRSKIFE